jgi:hypothetical protein
MIRRLLFFVLCLVTSSLVLAAPALSNPSKSTKPPKPLLLQIERLTELLRDRYAAAYPEATMVQWVRGREGREGEELVLTVFTLEGFGGGNNHTQYFAAFTPDMDEKGKPHFALIDVMPIAGKGWREVRSLNAKVSRNAKSNETLISFEAFEVVDDEPPNFPSKRVFITLLLKAGRLIEQKP